MFKKTALIALAFIASGAFLTFTTAESDAQCFRRGKRCGILSRICQRRAACPYPQTQANACCNVNYGNVNYASPGIYPTTSPNPCLREFSACQQGCQRQYGNTDEYHRCVGYCDLDYMQCISAYPGNGACGCGQPGFAAAPIVVDNGDIPSIDPNCNGVYRQCLRDHCPNGCANSGSCLCGSEANCKAYCLCQKIRCQNNSTEPCLCPGM